MEIEKLKQLQGLQLRMMKIIHNVCVKNNIEYYIIGGTLLGSVRHQGFIPWDIDIDIAMTRPNYDNFKKISSELPSQMAYKDYTSEPEFRAPHALVEWSDSYIVESMDNSAYKIFIDIFPLDTAPSDPKLQRKQARQISRLKILKYLKRRAISKQLKTTCLKRLFYTLFRIVTPSINIPKINIKMQEIMQRYNTSSAPEYLCSMASHYSYEKQCMPASIYGKPTLMTFCDTKFYAPAQPFEYLTRIYGDYMKLPNKETQEMYMKFFSDAGWKE